jgi:hypothetical protein
LECTDRSVVFRQRVHYQKHCPQPFKVQQRPLLCVRPAGGLGAALLATLAACVMLPRRRRRAAAAAAAAATARAAGADVAPSGPSLEGLLAPAWKL